MQEDEEFRKQLLDRVDRYKRAATKAKDRLAEIEEEIRTLESRQQAAEKLYKAEFGASPPTARSVAVTPPPIRRGRPKREIPRSNIDGPLTGMTWQDAMRDVLANGPLHVREIWDRLDEGGFQTDSQDPLRSIVAVALRMPELTRTDANTYGFAGSAPKSQPEKDREVQEELPHE